MVCGMLSVVVERTPADPTALHTPIPILSRKTPRSYGPRRVPGGLAIPR